MDMKGIKTMKILVINGSARKGNTSTAIQAFAEGAANTANGNEVEILAADKLSIAPCKGCGSCQCSKGCIDKDDTNPTVDKIVSADMIVFATPVYWWGITAQTKLVIDKCYCKGQYLRGKKVGLIVVGAASIDSIQYELINKQFDCIAEYLSWDMLFQKSYSACDKEDLSHNKEAVAELKALGSNL